VVVGVDLVSQALELRVRVGQQDALGHLQRDAHIAAVGGVVAAAPGDTVVVGAVGRITQRSTDLTGRPDLTASIALLTLVLRYCWVRGHAFAPGHGKTVMAAYLVGRHDRRRCLVTAAVITVVGVAAAGQALLSG
jgi:nickel/cobalt transporter (NicO) family protein